MASSKMVVACVIGFVLGAATMGVLLSVLASPESVPPIAPVPITPVAPVAPAPEPRPVPTPPPPAPLEPAEEAPVEVAEPEPPPEPAEPERPTRGTGTIQGVVRTSNGTPLVGVLVRGTAHDPEVRRLSRRRSAPPPRRDPQDAAEQVRWQNAASREATTDVAGRYELDGLLDMPYGLQAWRKGYQIRPAGRTWETQAGVTFNFVATRVAGVRVSVLRPDGSSHDDATLDWQLTGRRGGGQAAMWSATQPIIDVEPGTYDLSVRSRRDDAYRSEAVRVVVPADDDTVPDVEIRLIANTMVAGTVVVAPDQAWHYLTVWIAPLAPGADPAQTASATIENRDRDRSTGARSPDYSFQLTGLTPGRHVLAASAGARHVSAHEVVDVLEGRNEFSIRMPELGPMDVLVVDVRGPAGSPVPDLEFGYVERGNNRTRGMGLRGSQQQDGSWRVLLAGARSGEPQPDTEYTLSVKSAELGTRDVVFRPGSDSRLVVSYASPATLRVTTPGFPNAYPDGLLTLVLVHRGVDDGAIMQASVRARREQLTGHAWTSGAVEPGEYDLVLTWVPDRGHPPRQLTRVPLTLTPGETVHELAPPALHSLTVRIGAASPGTTVGIASAVKPGAHEWTATIESERATFDNLPPGRYVIAHTVKGERSEMIVEVRGDHAVSWAPIRLDGLRITDVEPGGYLHTVGFREGDVITLIDGAEFETSWHAWKRFGDAARKGSYELTVQRGSSVIRLDVTGVKMNGRRAVGGHWVPVSR